MAKISDLVDIDPTAQIGADVSIGSFCVIGPNVIIGDGCKLMNNVTIQGVTSIGRNNIFYQNVVIGEAPQDLKYGGAPTETIIGDGNVFREYCTVHRGTELGGGKTIIGSDNLIMVAAHIAHDCRLEDKIILGNQTQLAGHVSIEEGAVLSALVGLHHFVRVGRYSYIGGLTPVRRDVPPYMKFSSDSSEARLRVRAVNEEGLKRHRFREEDITAIKKAFRKLFRQDNNRVETVLEEMLNQEDINKHVQYLCNFVLQSCQSRFHRYREISRRDSFQDRLRHKPTQWRNINC